MASWDLEREDCPKKSKTKQSFHTDFFQPDDQLGDLKLSGVKDEQSVESIPSKIAIQLCLQNSDCGQLFAYEEGIWKPVVVVPAGGRVSMYFPMMHLVNA
jgi:hypothetical protein